MLYAAEGENNLVMVPISLLQLQQAVIVLLNLNILHARMTLTFQFGNKVIIVN